MTKLTIFFLILISACECLAITKAPGIPATVSTCKDCNLIVISFTAARKRNMSMYGYKRDTTPNINKFFQDSYIFNNAFAPATLTSTDAVTLFFSLSPNVHKTFFRRHKAQSLDLLLKYTSLAEMLTKNGYKTAAFVSDEDYDFNWGVGRTFQYYFDRSYYADYGIVFKPFTYTVGTKQLVPLVSNWLSGHQKEKKFLFLQAYDMHCPYTPRDQFAKLYDSPHSPSIPFSDECFMAKDKMKEIMVNGKKKYVLNSFFTFINQRKKRQYYFSQQDIDYLISRYDAEFNQADFNLSPLFAKIKELKLDQNSIIVFLSEHGDYLGENGYFMKPASSAQGNLHNANLNFPLAIKIPRMKAKNKFQNQIIQTMDLTPTFLDLLGIKPDLKMQGKSFKNIIDTALEINDFAYGYSVRQNFSELDRSINSYLELDTIQNHEWKLNCSREFKLPSKKFMNEKYFLFNLKKDPEEKMEISKKESAVFKKLKTVLLEKRHHYSRVQ
ncbi:MAG: sulfatase-like hydrolase/transferase [Bacteriovorax sp.]|jgi:arylsulfatase A-like enzyme